MLGNKMLFQFIATNMNREKADCTLAKVTRNPPIFLIGEIAFLALYCLKLETRRSTPKFRLTAEK